MKLDYDDFKDVLKPDIILKPGDTITIPYNGIDTEFVVLGVNINPNIGEEDKYDFIDIMSKELLIQNTVWKKKSNHNFDCIAFIKSDIIKELHSKLELFPQEIQAAVISKKERFLTGLNLITNERSYTTVDVGKVWLPSVKEICDDCYMSNSDPESKQYPYFINRENRRFGDWWWTCSAGAFLDYNAYYINSGGGRDYRYATDSGCGSPLCLRIRTN